MSNVSINLGAATNDTNQPREQRVGQTSDLGTQDAFHVVSREKYTTVTGNEQSSVTVGVVPGAQCTTLMGPKHSA
eukprot:6490293-Amphidinium_carterae.1